MIHETTVGNGKVYLIAGGGKIWTDIAARFVRSERPVEEIIESPYSPELLHRILDSNHKAALEFDYFLFGVEGYSRVCETQLVRKRHASYLIKSGRVELGGKRKFNVCLPVNINDFSVETCMPLAHPCEDGSGDTVTDVKVRLTAANICDMIAEWYSQGIRLGKKEEDLRYLKPQATEFRAIIGMNAHALYDFFGVRCCMNAQAEIRDLANKMLALCMDAAPDLFVNAGPNCRQLGYCPENSMQNAHCAGRVLTREKALSILRNYSQENVISG